MHTSISPRIKSGVFWQEPPINLQLVVGQLHLWLFDASLFPMCPDNFYSSLSADEVERADSFVFASDRQQFKFYRAALRTVLALYLKCCPAELIFNYNRYGRPTLALLDYQNPVYFNLSHSGNLAVAVISNSMEVGVDIEKILTKVEMKQIAKEFFSFSEFKQLISLPETELTDGFYRCWTSKEAYLKSKGTGLSIPLDQFQIDFIDKTKPKLIWSTLFPGDVSTKSFFSSKIKNNYLMTFVTEKHIKDFKYYNFTNSLVT